MFCKCNRYDDVALGGCGFWAARLCWTGEAIAPNGLFTLFRLIDDEINFGGQSIIRGRYNLPK